MASATCWPREWTSRREKYHVVLLPPMVRVSVVDTGTGIPTEDMPRLFDRFYRVDKSRTRTSGGTGLGLSVAKQLVESHGGRMWAESKLGEGSVFQFTLPLAQPPACDATTEE